MTTGAASVPQVVCGCCGSCAVRNPRRGVAGQTGLRELCKIGPFHYPQLINFVFPVQSTKYIEVAGSAGSETLISTLALRGPNFFGSHMSALARKGIPKKFLRVVEKGWKQPFTTRTTRTVDPSQGLTCTSVFPKLRVVEFSTTRKRRFGRCTAPALPATADSSAAGEARPDPPHPSSEGPRP